MCNFVCMLPDLNKWDWIGLDNNNNNNNNHYLYLIKSFDV